MKFFKILLLINIDDKLKLSNDCINLINLIKKLFEFDDEKRNKNFNSSLDFEQFKKYESNSNVDLMDKIVILILYFKKVKLSFDIFNIKQRAKEFGMKLKIFSEEGEVIVNSSYDRIKILVNV